MDLETFRWLLTDEGQSLLAAAGTAEGTPLHVQAALRELATAEQVTAAQLVGLDADVVPASAGDLAAYLLEESTAREDNINEEVVEDGESRGHHGGPDSQSQRIQVHP